MANTTPQTNPFYSEAEQTHGPNHPDRRLKDKGIVRRADDKVSKDKMLENIRKKYRSAWKKLAKL
jgi:hypothetical protein